MACSQATRTGQANEDEKGRGDGRGDGRRDGTERDGTERDGRERDDRYMTERKWMDDVFTFTGSTTSYDSNTIKTCYDSSFREQLKRKILYLCLYPTLNYYIAGQILSTPVFESIPTCSSGEVRGGSQQRFRSLKDVLSSRPIQGGGVGDVGVVGVDIGSERRAEDIAEARDEVGVQRGGEENLRLARKLAHTHAGL